MKKLQVLLGFTVLVVALYNNGLAHADDGLRSSISAAEFLNSEAGALFQSGDYERTLSALDALIEKYPGDPLLLRYRAMTLDRLGRSSEAIPIFKKLLKTDADHVPTRYFLGQAYYRSGNAELASKEWARVAKDGKGTTYGEWAETALVRTGDLRMGGVPTKVKRWNVAGRYGYEYDSNVILRPDDDSLAAASDQNSGRQVADLGMRYRLYSRGDAAVDFNYSVRQTIHDDGLNEFNYHSEEVGLNLRKRITVGDRDVVAGLRYDFLMGFLEDDLFSVKNRWILSADTRFAPRTRTLVYDRITIGNFARDGFSPGTTSRDGVFNEAGVTQYLYSKNFQNFAFVTGEFDSAHTRGRNFDSVGGHATVGLHAAPHKRWHLDASSGLKLSFYHNFSSISTADSSRRRGVDWDLYGGVTYYITPNVGVRGFYRYIHAWNQNNFFDYTRHIGGAQVIYSLSF